MTMADERLFVREPARWTSLRKHCKMLKARAEAPVYEHALVLPLRPVPSSEVHAPVKDMVCRGGVCDERGHFVAGRRRGNGLMLLNLECYQGYRPSDECDGPCRERDERVLFGGVLYRHFGHALIDSMARLWRAVGHDDFSKVVFVEFPFDFPSAFDPMEMIGLLGIPPEKIEIVKQPTRFREVIVPDEAFKPFAGYMPEFVDMCRGLAERLTLGSGQAAWEAQSQQPVAAPARKVYLARTPEQVQAAHGAPEAFGAAGAPDGAPSASSGAPHGAPHEGPRSFLNEEQYQQFFARRGYEIVYPDQLPVAEQIRTVASAEEIVAVHGTLSHLLLFARPDATATILVRENPSMAQTVIDQACGMRPYYVDACSNPLPVRHVLGPFLFLPNRHFRAYLDARGIEYDASELNVEERLPELVFEFMQKWAQTYRQQGAAETYINTCTMHDVIAHLNDALYDDTFDEDAYRAADDLRGFAKVMRYVTRTPLWARFRRK